MQMAHYKVAIIIIIIIIIIVNIIIIIIVIIIIITLEDICHHKEGNDLCLILGRFDKL